MEVAIHIKAKDRMEEMTNELLSISIIEPGVMKVLTNTLEIHVILVVFLCQ